MLAKVVVGDKIEAVLSKAKLAFLAMEKVIECSDVILTKIDFANQADKNC